MLVGGGQHLIQGMGSITSALDVHHHYPTNTASVSLVMGCSKVFFVTILTSALAY